MLGTLGASPPFTCQSSGVNGAGEEQVAPLARSRSSSLVEQGMLLMKGSTEVTPARSDQLRLAFKEVPLAQQTNGTAASGVGFKCTEDGTPVRPKSCPFALYGRSRFFDTRSVADEHSQRYRDRRFSEPLPNLLSSPSRGQQKKHATRPLSKSDSRRDDGSRRECRACGYRSVGDESRCMKCNALFSGGRVSYQTPVDDRHSVHQRRDSAPEVTSVKQGLALRLGNACNEFAGKESLIGQGVSTPEVFVHDTDLASKSSEDARKFTEPQKKFSAAVAGIRAKNRLHTRSDAHGMISVRTYLDAQDYDLELATEKRRSEPGSIQLIYMFYSRLYEKLIGKQKHVEINLFAPIDLSERLLGFHAILDFAHDFNLIPSRTTRHELERFYATVNACADGPDTVQRKFESKINYHEFVDLLALCTEGGEPMDRSRVDKSTIHVADTRLERVKRLSSLLGLGNISKVRLTLHNAYRDVHFLKLGDGIDFEKEARAIEIRSRPQRRVELLPDAKRLDRLGADAAALKHLEHFTWRSKAHNWEEFELPIIDMGSAFMNEPSKHCRLTITNRQSFLARVRLECIDCGIVRLPWEEISLSPGQTVDAKLEFVAEACGEWCGSILINAEWTAAGGYEKVSVPTYMRVMQPQTADDKSLRLPMHASPLRPGSASYAFHVLSDGRAKVPVFA